MLKLKSAVGFMAFLLSRPGMGHNATWHAHAPAGAPVGGQGGPDHPDVDSSGESLTQPVSFLQITPVTACGTGFVGVAWTG